MKCVFIFLYAFLPLLFPAQAAVGGTNAVNKINPAIIIRAGYQHFFVDDKNCQTSIGLDNDGLDDDADCVVELDNDDVNSESNNDIAAKKKNLQTILPAAYLLFKKNIHGKAGILISPEQNLLGSGIPIIIFISQFRL